MDAEHVPFGVMYARGMRLTKAVRSRVAALTSERERLIAEIAERKVRVLEINQQLALASKRLARK